MVEQGASHFIHVVQRAAAESRQRKERIVVLLTLDAFYDDPMLLYAALWYAYSSGVIVTFLSKQQTKETSMTLTMQASPNPRKGKEDGGRKS